MQLRRHQREPAPKFEMEQRPSHLEYGAVPLDTWNARYPGSPEVDYVNGSLGHIDDKVQEARAEAVVSGLLSRDAVAALAEFMKESLYESQLYRIDLNSKCWARDVLDETDERDRRALTGTATPDDLLGILVDYPEFGSAELAKLSHPLKWEDSYAMDRDVIEMLMERGAKLLGEPAYYKGKIYDKDIPARIILRKQPIADCETEHGTIRIIQRKSLVVHGEVGASNDPQLARMIRNPERLEELIEKVSHAYDYLGELSDCISWLHVEATTYYATYLPRVATKSAA